LFQVRTSTNVEVPYPNRRLLIEPQLFGAALYIPTMIVPPLLVIHALIFLILLRTEKASVA
jgi:hypothetical protein